MISQELNSFNGKRIILSRTDGIGDVILSLPLAGVLKKHFPDCYLIFLGRDYTLPLIECSQHIDQAVSFDSYQALKEKDRIEAFNKLKADVIFHVFPQKEVAYLAKQSQVPLRIGTSHRLWHWLSCNYLLPLTRKNTDLHEATLNLQLIKPFIKGNLPEINEIYKFYGLNKLPELTKEFSQISSQNIPNLILHPFTKGSAREWGIDNFFALAKLLQPHFRIFISGSPAEGKGIQNHPMLTLENVIDVTGKFSLSEFIGFINHCDGLVAASTGPLHIASALGKMAVGLYPPIRPMHPGRWAPLGENAHFIVESKACNACRKTGNCDCMKAISPQKVADMILRNFNF